MKWLVLFIICIQVGWVSSCVFDKVEGVWGSFYQKIKDKDESGCFTACYEDNNCAALAYRKTESRCYLFSARYKNYTHPCISGNVCYTLQRDEEDTVCQRYVDV